MALKVWCPLTVYSDGKLMVCLWLPGDAECNFFLLSEFITHNMISVKAPGSLTNIVSVISVSSRRLFLSNEPLNFSEADKNAALLQYLT